MRNLICLSVILFGTVLSWSQATPAAAGGATLPDDQGQMAVPPAVNDRALPTEVGSEARSNFVRGEVALGTSYVDNLYAGSGTNPLGETIYSIAPKIIFDRTTSREHRMFSYRPAFTIYHPSSTLNDVDHNADMQYQLRLTPHTSLFASDTFQKSSTSFAAGNGAGGTVSGAPPSMATPVIAPFAERLINNANARLSVQCSADSMVGVSGTSMMLRYPKPKETMGLYDSDERGGSAFYNRRISGGQYVGASYRYSLILSYPPSSESEVQTHLIYGFYTIYPKPNISISVSGGPQHYEVTQAPLPTASAWKPMFMGSVSWQAVRANISASYSRQVSGGGGLLGAFLSTSSGVSARWQVARTWFTEANVNYSVTKNVAPSLLLAGQQGNSLLGSIMVEHTLSNQFTLDLEYDHIRQSYGGIPSAYPNSNRMTVSLKWWFMRELGR